MVAPVHVHLKDEKGRLEEVEAYPGTNGQYELAYSPIAVMGLARGDIVCLNGTRGDWMLVHPGGNVSIQFFVPAPVGNEQNETDRLVREVGGLVDHRRGNMFVASMPRIVGHGRIMEIIKEISIRCPAVEWQYGNVRKPDGSAFVGWEEFYST